MSKWLALALSVLTISTTTLSADGGNAKDREILHIIQERLQSHGYNNSQNPVRISVRRGEVVFRGKVDSKREQELLRDIALDIPGVSHVIVNVYVRDIDPMKNKRISNRRTGPRY